MTSADFYNLEPMDRIKVRHGRHERVALVYGRPECGQIEVRLHKLDACGWVARTTLIKRDHVIRMMRPAKDRQRQREQRQLVMF